MSKRGWFIIFIYIVILVSAFTFIFGKKLFIQKKAHYHAGFIIFENDKKKDFSDVSYMNVRPCKVDKTKSEEPVSDSELQREKAHLHDYVGDVVHIEREGAKWKDLLINLPYNINYSEANAYINGEKINNFQNQTIHPYDSIVVFVGKNNVKLGLSKAVVKSHIQLEEKKSEDCGM